ncbi:MAG: insulinase family protein, partial [Gammaproteobacteria bacterium]|nr:insulinase family protein [Gammaproteobacteria bacterium]
SNLGLALQLASSVTLYGDWRTTFERTARLYDVQPADVQRVVQTYFTRDNRTVATLVKPTGETDP